MMHASFAGHAVVRFADRIQRVPPSRIWGFGIGVFSSSSDNLAMSKFGAVHPALRSRGPLDLRRRGLRSVVWRLRARPNSTLFIG